jgi:hypothetical protein
MERVEEAGGYYASSRRVASGYADTSTNDQSPINLVSDKTTYYRKEDLEQDRLHLWFKDLVPDVCLRPFSSLP